MLSSQIASLLWKVGCGLALMLLGVAAVTHAAPDSNLALFGLFSHLVGLLCLALGLRPLLFPANSLQTEEIPTARQMARSNALPLFGSRFVRFVLSLLLLIVPGYILWNAGADLGPLFLLANGGKATAQVIGREILPQEATTGYVHFAFRAEGIAVESRFAVPRTAYAIYWTGYPLQVTYRKSQPRDFRLGVVGADMVARRGLFWLLLLINSLLFFGVPLRWINRRKSSLPSL